MNVDLELYRVFYTVAKHKHMTKASEELHISQPAISQSIKKLEDQLGGTLFLRSNKGMELTEEGKMFYEYVKGALELINNAEKEFTSFKDLSKGEIKIGCSTTLTKLVLIDSLKDFHIDYPNININITYELFNKECRKITGYYYQLTDKFEKKVKIDTEALNNNNITTTLWVKYYGLVNQSEYSYRFNSSVKNCPMIIQFSTIDNIYICHDQNNRNLFMYRREIQLFNGTSFLEKLGTWQFKYFET